MALTRLNSMAKSKTRSLFEAQNGENYDLTPYSDGVSWTRDPQWIAMPTMTSSDEKFSALIAVDDTTEGWLRIYVNGTNYTIDWGDGTSTSGTGSVWYDHAYDYSNSNLANTNIPVTFGSNVVTLSGHGYTNGSRIDFYESTVADVEQFVYYHIVNATANTFQLALTEGGSPITIGTGTGILLPYKQALLTITPDDPIAGDNIQIVQTNGRHPSASTDYQTNILEIEASLPNCTYFLFYGSGQLNYLLQRVKIHTVSSSMTNISNIFNGTYGLQKADMNFNNAVVTNATTLFYNNVSLKDLTMSNLSINASSVSQMFYFCVNLRQVPEFSITNCTSFNSMFNSCYSLKRVPFTNFSSSNLTGGGSSSFDAFTANMHNLLESPYPWLPTKDSYDLDSIVNDCRRLNKIGYINTSSVNSLVNFIYYSGIKYLPTINVPSSCTSMDGVFRGNLLTEARITGDTSNVTNSRYMFYDSPSLRQFVKVDSLTNEVNFNSSTTVLGMFYECESLRKIPRITCSSAVTDAYQFMQNTSIKNFDATGLNFDGATRADYLFYANYRLKELPNISLNSAINATHSFSNNFVLEKIGTITAPLLQQADNMFSASYSLEEIPDISFPEVLDAQGMFNSCFTLYCQNVSLPKATNIYTLFYQTKGTERVNVYAPLATNGALAFTGSANYGWSNIHEVTGDLSSMASNQSMFQYAVRLKKLLITINNNLIITYLDLSDQALDDLYTYLPTVSGKTINITNTRGRLNDTPSIATAKGWTVTG